MLTFNFHRLILLSIAVTIAWLATPRSLLAQENEVIATDTLSVTLLTDPFLQLPTADGVHVVWFTEWEGSEHTVAYGAELTMVATATTTKCSRGAEDARSRVGEQVENGQVYNTVTPRDIWRHEALIMGLTPGERVPYYVTSTTTDGEIVQSETFTLQPLPETGQPLKSC